MINFHSINNLYLGKPLSFKELEQRRQRQDKKIITLWGYLSSAGNGNLYALYGAPFKVTLKSTSQIARFVERASIKCFTRYIAFTTKERAKTFIESIDYMTEELKRKSDYSEYYTEVYD